MKESKNNGAGAQIKKGIFWPAIISVLAVVLFMIIFEPWAEKTINMIFGFCTDQLGFIYLWFAAFALGTVIWFGFGRCIHTSGSADRMPNLNSAAGAGLPCSFAPGSAPL